MNQGPRHTLRTLSAFALLLVTPLAAQGEKHGGNIEAGKIRYSPYADKDYPTEVYFGDTHHHTANSGDAFMNGDRLGPADAYRFARGEQVVSSSGVPVKLSRPLDFLVISDHAEGLGVMYEVYNQNPNFMANDTLKRWSQMMKAGGKEASDAMNEVISGQAQGTLPGEVTDPKISGPVMRSVWQEYTETADQFNDPGPLHSNHRFRVDLGARG